jgi:hypothetical protein
LEKDLDRLLKIGDEDATACREAHIFDKYSDSDDNPEPKAMYWKGMEPSKLLCIDAHLVAYIQGLPYQEGRPPCIG